ncbi:MAG: ABC-F family ATP-binding cassette domain-containing protein [Clostridiales bacterium]|nr:ABC-F family ATP-binding cassette domain-containing protein [Clostridiales bacterium]
MLLLSASNIKKMFSDETLFDNVSFSIDSDDKIGFVGVNGAGKSTLFKIITGQTDYDSGEMFKNKLTNIGYLDQYAVSGSTGTVWEEALSAFSDLIEIEQELEDIRFDIENKRGNAEFLTKRQNALQEKFQEGDGFYYKSRAKSTLMGLGFGEDELNLEVSKLSGGQKTRVALAKILLGKANLLLLDEPTNHLDIESVEWLEGFLQSYKGAFAVISHDRYFLDKVTNKTFELDGGRFKSYGGGYSQYIKQREIDKKTEERSYENTMREIERLEGIVEQQKRWNREKNIKTAKSKQKVIDRLEKDLIKPVSAAEEMTFSFKACPGGGQDVVETKGLSMAFGKNELFSNVDMLVKKGERVFILGPNGCGKTTFLKILMGMCPQTAGEYKIGANIHIGYYDQIQENLSMDKTVIDEVWDEYPKLTQTQIRNALAALLFRGEDVFKEISKLSGGERARVELVKLMLQSVNLLIMDEPTNHLDIESREALENALSGFDGTMIMVSHDRYFINKLADRVFVMTKNGIKEYRGGYDDYAAAKTQSPAPQKIEKGMDYKEQKQLRARKKKILGDFSKTEREIGDLEEQAKIKQREIEACACDYVEAARISDEINDINERLEELYETWAELQEIIEEAYTD